jgi:hypothetical protein
VLRSRFTKAAFAAVLSAGVVLGADSLPSIATNVVQSKDGKLMLELSGVVPEGGKWLGVSFYLPDFNDPVWQGEHAVYSITEGPFKVSFPVPQGFEKGSYEVGLWQQKLGENAYYQPQWLKAYASGRLAGGQDTLELADSLSALAAEVSTSQGRKVLKVGGKALDQRWLGVSFYKKGYADPVLDGSYSMLSIPKGQFSQTIAVPAGFEDGTYEAALWVRLLSKKRVFRLEGELAHGSGKVGK